MMELHHIMMLIHHKLYDSYKLHYPKWTSFVNWSSLTLVVFSYFDFQNTLTVTADHFLAYKAAESFLRTTF